MPGLPCTGRAVVPQLRARHSRIYLLELNPSPTCGILICFETSPKGPCRVGGAGSEGPNEGCRTGDPSRDTSVRLTALPSHFRVTQTPGLSRPSRHKQQPVDTATGHSV